MAKVVLVWNEHPVEVVAGYHCRQVAKLLRKMGHEVIVEKIPAKDTNYGILQRKSPEEAVKALRKIKPSLIRAQQYGKKHGTTAFNFHASEIGSMGRASSKIPDKFTVGQFEPGQHPFSYPTEIVVEKYDGHFLIEIPGYQTAVPDFEGKWRKRSAAFKAAKDDYNIERNLAKDYHLFYMPLKRREQQKYLHPAISEKIARAIHERITSQGR